MAYCGCNRNHAARRCFGQQEKERHNGRQGGRKIRKRVRNRIPKNRNKNQKQA